MTEVRAMLRIVGRRRATLAVAVCGTALLAVAWSAERRRADLKQEVRWLEQRLGEKRAIIARQRQEMSEVAGAVDRVTLAAGALRERSTQVRHAAHMEESRDVGADVAAIKATLDGGRSIVSEDA